MKLNISFNKLTSAINQMNPEMKGKFSGEFKELPDLIQKDVVLIRKEGVTLKDVDIDSIGLLSYQGKQVLLYIKDHGSNVQQVIQNPESGRRFHIADCSTLKSMRSEGRFERYVVTNDISGSFLISGSGYYSNQVEEGHARLKVCKCCLNELNYKGYSSGRNKSYIFDGFSMSELFKTYSSFFPCLPSRFAETAETDYVKDWSKISSHYRVEKNFICECCNVNLREYRGLLHVHHINGVKSDNKLTNLKALCIDCHSKQPFHAHMVLDHSKRVLINELRQSQGLLNKLNNWDDIFKMADPGVHGVLYACQSQRYRLPQVGYCLTDNKNGVIARLELAWPNYHFGIAISIDDSESAKKEGWTIVTIKEFLENYKLYAKNFRY